MSPWETLLAVASLALFDVWLFWFVWGNERERREQLRRKGRRGRTYAEIHYVEKRRVK